MADFSRRQMLREYAGELRVIKTLLLSSFGGAVIFFWILYIRKAEHTMADVRLFACLPLAVCGFALGLYTVLTSDRWLIRHTPLGNALQALGNAETLMAQIDGEAVSAETLTSGLLMQNWLILFYSFGTKLKPDRVCARPVMVRDVDRVLVAKERNGGFRMDIYGKDLCLGRMLLPEMAEWKAALQWIQSQEIEIIWSK